MAPRTGRRPPTAPRRSVRTPSGLVRRVRRGRRRTRRPVLSIESIHEHKSPGFAAALKLYNSVFPDKERIDRRYFAEMLQEKRLGLLFPFDLHFLVARAGKRVVGLATGTYLAVVNMGFVGYLAVDPHLKGSRIGSRLRRRLVSDLRRSARASGQPDLDGVMGEVEGRNPWLRHLVRQGVYALDLDYRQPPLRDATKAVSLVLYIEPVARPITVLAASKVRALLYAIYRRIYRVRFPLRLPAFRRMLRDLHGRRTVGRWTP